MVKKNGLYLMSVKKTAYINFSFGKYESDQFVQLDVFSYIFGMDKTKL